ncbi:lytic polysaccharide monooxygenase [Microbacterium sp. YY-01]|uniref:lytic polysaccharide monooxygenase n=1 Tax=Microbacterium sp. YY-01 TaxID=3421634 RepID=UPI003D173EB5
MKRFRSMAVVVAVAAGLLAGGAMATSASAHGWVTDPGSRQDHCSTGATSFDCGGIKYEPQSVEAPKGSMLCSGGNEGFAILDDDSRPWPRTTIDSTTTFTWKITARHSTTSWEYFVDGERFKTYYDNGKRPEATVQHTLQNLPAGDHTILARWTIDDTINAFYSCIDVTVGEGGSVTPTPDPTTDPEPTPDPEPTTGPVEECDAVAWNSGTIYTGGEKVSHDGVEYRAAWWTLGETPGTTGEWGVWKELGECA